MTYPTHEAGLKLLEEWKTHHESTKQLMDSIEETIGLDLDGPLFNTVWKLFHAYTEAIASQLGDRSRTYDDEGWMVWYYSENHMGEKGMQAGIDGKLTLMHTLADLLDLIEQSRD